jgi:hypothetical protein
MNAGSGKEWLEERVCVVTGKCSLPRNAKRADTLTPAAALRQNQALALIENRLFKFILSD